MSKESKQKILAMIRDQQFEQAKACCEALCRQQPDDPEAWFLLGALCGQIGDFDAAERHSGRAVELRSDIPMAWHNLAIARLRLGNKTTALHCLQKAVQLDPAFASAWATLGKLHSSQGRNNDALAAFRRALKSLPGMPEALTGIAELHERLNDPAQAYHELRPLLEMNSVPACAAIVLGRIADKLELQKEAIELIKTVLNKGTASRAEEQELHFRLGHLYDGQCRYDDAFREIKTANELFQQPYNERGRAEYFRRLITTFNTENLPRMARASINSSRPVFIVGMPRSGSTLIEQILSSHRGITGGGELTHIGDLVASFTTRFGPDAIYPGACMHLDGAKLDSLAQDYLGHLDELSPNTLRVTDKMPHNFLHLGLIDQLFPGARIIHCRRDPLDTCLSIYFNNFNATHPYACDLHNLGSYYRAYQELMQHWKVTLRTPVLDVEYEAMVASPGETAHSLTSFCGLPWDSQCLRFYESKRPVETLSYDQVRRPVYRTSVGRWKNYESHLGPLLDVLLQPAR
jgi:tetratricopeptide (TPR) repeat protein